MRNKLRQLLADTEGATVVEYGLIISLIILAIVGAVTGVATTTTDMWNNVAEVVTNNS
jgi:pilus assembly protein Flp/PilA